MELVTDARCENMTVATDHRLLSQWMLQLCQVIGMTPVGEPELWDFPWPGGTVGAPTAFLPLKESGISVHVYPEFDYVYLNVFSCKAFDPKKAKRFIRRSLQVRTMRSRVFQRGIDMETGAPLELRQM